jgi:uncharacterized protein YcbK (DUF882 family)
MNGPSPHLAWDELACADGTVYPEAWRETRLPELARVYEGIRLCAGNRPIRILSAYRTSLYNSRVEKAAKTSQHVQGRALDLQHESLKPIDLYDLVIQLAKTTLPEIGGVGLYHWGVHVDTRPHEPGVLAVWQG